MTLEGIKYLKHNVQNAPFDGPSEALFRSLVLFPNLGFNNQPSLNFFLMAFVNRYGRN